MQTYTSLSAETENWSLCKVKSTALSLFLDMFQYGIVWTFVEVYSNIIPSSRRFD